MDLQFEEFDYKKNLEQQRELFCDCFPETKGDTIQTPQHYLWKFHSFPHSPTSWEYASYIENEMVGYYAAIPYNYRIGETTTPVGMVCDVMTNSNHRGKGIFTKMGSYSLSNLASNVPFTMGYPIRKEVIPGHLKVGWKIPFSLPLYMKFLRLNSLFSARKLGFLAPLANLFLFIYNGVTSARKHANYSISFTDNIEDVVGYDEFVLTWANSVRNTLIKNLEFAKWRYGAPNRNYIFLSVRDENNKLIAFLSLRKIQKEGVPSYGIIDYMVLNEHLACHGDIDRALRIKAKSDGVEAIMTMMSANSAKKYQLVKHGFFKSPFVFQLIINNLSKEFTDSEIFDVENWHLMWVDSDDL